MTWIPIDPRGGQANSASPTARPPGFAELLLNMYYLAGRWVRRRGIQTVHAVPYTDRLVSAWLYRRAPSDGPAVATLMAASAGVGAPPAILKRIGAAFAPVPFNGVSPDVQTGQEWRPFEHASHANEAGFLCRRGEKPGNGKLLHVTPQQVTAAGIPGPTAAPTVGAGAAGALTGTWAGCQYSFVTSDKSAESNASPMSPAVTLANQKRSWSALQAPTHPRVGYWRLYVPREGANNTVTYEAVDIPVSTALPYEEEIADAALGSRAAPTGNYPPPANPEHVTLWDNRIVLTLNEEGIAGWAYTTISESGIEYEAYDTSKRLLRLAPIGGKRAQASLAWDLGEELRLALLTDHVVAIASPTAVPDVYAIAELEGSRGHGVLSANAARVGGGMLVWYCGEHVHMSDGRPAEIISTDEVEETLAAVPEAYRERAFMSWRRGDGGFFALSIPSGAGSTDPDLELCWSPRHGWGGRQRNVAGAKAATFVTSVVPGCPLRSGAATASIDIACYAGDNRVAWLDSPSLNDAGLVATGDVPVKVHVRAILPTVPTQADGGQIVVGGVMFTLERRRDLAPSLSSTARGTGLSVSLRLDGLRETTPVPAERQQPSKTVFARAENLGDAADYVQPIIEGDTDDALEITRVFVDAESIGIRRSA